MLYMSYMTKAQLLLVRSFGDIDPSLSLVERFLAHERAASESDGQTDLVGIWVNEYLERDLPSCFHARTERLPSQTLEPEVGVLKSISCSGIWTLCWLEGCALQGELRPDERRHAVLRTLVVPAAAMTSSTESGSFLPVFAQAAPAAEMRASWRQLASRYSSLIGEPYLFSREGLKFSRPKFVRPRFVRPKNSQTRLRRI